MPKGTNKVRFHILSWHVRRANRGAAIIHLKNITMNNEQRLSDAYSDIKNRYANLKINLTETKKELAVLKDQVAFFSDPESNVLNAKLVYYEQLLRGAGLLNDETAIYKSGYVSAEKYKNVQKERNALVEKNRKLKIDLANMQATRKKLFTDNE